jgi:hypothetical protein
VGLVAALGALLGMTSAPAQAAGSLLCPVVTRGTLTEIASRPGLIVVANVVKLNEPGTPATDWFQVHTLIRQGPEPVGYLADGTLAVPANACWDDLHPGDRIVAIFPYPDTLVAERSVAWRIDPDGSVTQASHQEVSGVPKSGTALIQALARIVTGLPVTSTAVPLTPHGEGAPIESGLVILAAWVGGLIAMRWRFSRTRRPHPR